jgi:glycosyltransferase involved in cell wall biosynthesis
VVGLNRRLAHEMACAGSGRWEVTAIAPRFIRGDLRPIALEELPGEASRLETIGVYGSRSPHLMFYPWRLRGLLRAGWDLVHCWEEPYVLAGFQVAWWTPTAVPFVFWTAQNLSKRYPPPFSSFERYCLKRATGWLACGQTTVDAMGARGYEAVPHRIMPLGVDLNVFRPDTAAGTAVRARLGWSAGPPVVGYLGRFVAEKGVSLLTRVLDRIDRPWRALFVGGGPLEPELRAWATRHGDRVRVCTGVAHDQVPAHLNAMDVLAAPSQSLPRWQEQLGRMLVEAFACGVPVVGSDSGEVPYVIGDAGVVVPEADEAAWSAALVALLEDPDRRAERAGRGLERAGQFAWPAIARSHLAFFDELLDRVHRPSARQEVGV